MVFIRMFVCWPFLAAAVLMQAGCQTSQVAATPRAYDPAFREAQYEKSIQRYTRAIEQNPGDAEAYFRRGFFYSLEGRDESAAEDFTWAIKLNPANVSAYENRGTIYYREGEYDAGLTDYTRAIELQPNYAVAYQNRAICYCALKDYDKAWADIEACRQNGGRPDGEFVAFLARVSGRGE